MNIKSFLGVAVIVLLTLHVSAQTSSSDSAKVFKKQLKMQMDSMEISQKLVAQRADLAKMEALLIEKTATAKRDTEDAQQAADNNAKQASVLAGDAQDKKRARTAERSADAASSSAKKARKSASSVDDLTKDIKSLKEKIQDGEAKLQKLYPTAM